ncbi:MAG: alanine--tRNA ligase [Candidatus Omnitrophota bacterium]|nr:alanine--tRNA ligase [Candidatus Omnitrophota bacterium]
MNTDTIRQAFLDFFKSKAHTIVESDSLAPKDDPTLLFTGAGMNQFKEKFLGRGITYRRAASSQKCLRTGDLENVGRTPGHHTFFEMLGNFSFGDYFKKEAILWAWEFLVNGLQLKTERLWVSIYKDDDEARNIWKDAVNVPEEKIIRFGEKENFWPSEAPTKGPNGPCGPCSEIFYDYGKDAGCGRIDCTPACGCGRFIEIWNLVFTQFDRQPDGSLKPLPNKNIDTGMGLERIASVTQCAKSNFEIDIFRPIVAMIEKEIDRRPKTTDQRPQTENQNSDSKIRISKMNAIADHIRAVVFCIADGVMPSNEGRGYVVRKLIRRSASYARDIGSDGPVLYKLVSIISEVMAGPYPELKEARDDIAQVIKREEENYMVVIETQVPKVEEAFENIKKRGDIGMLSEAAFNFYDTYGMPYEMLEEISEKFELRIDRLAFDRMLDRQREESRRKTKIREEIFTETFAQKIGALGLKTEFLGYEESRAQANVLAVLEGGEVILDKTPFYGESGGQAGDCGRIETKSGAMEVEDAKRIGDTIVHIGKMLRGHIVKNEIAEVEIDEKARKKTMANHTATHLLQAALKKVLGEHVHQTGSLVDSGHLRFDFTHMKKMEAREIARVEELVNEAIKKGLAVRSQIKGLGDARREGAMALFGEKYGQEVRVVSIGDISKELCGGTHVDNTKAIGVVSITSESSIASGVRRIEALTGEAAKGWMAKREDAQNSKLKAERRQEEEKRRIVNRIKEETKKVDGLIAQAKAIGPAKVITAVIDDINLDGLRILSDRIKEKAGRSVVILAATAGDRVSFIVNMTEGLAEKNMNASAIARGLAEMIDGSGGGRDTFAQGGGKSPEKLEGAFGKIFEIIKGGLA